MPHGVFFLCWLWLLSTAAALALLSAAAAGQKPLAPRGWVPEGLGTQKGSDGSPRRLRGDAGAKRTPTEGEPSLGDSSMWEGL